MPAFRESLKILKEVTAAHPLEARARRAVGMLYNAIAELEYHTGAPVEAMKHHEQSLAVRRAVAADPESDDDARAELDETLMAIGWLRREAGQGAEALSAYEEARDHLEELARKNPSSQALRKSPGALL